MGHISTNKPLKTHNELSKLNTHKNNGSTVEDVFGSGLSLASFGLDLYSVMQTE